jgi:hypothetical protein
MCICLFWLTSSKNDVFFSITISRGTVEFRGTRDEKPWPTSTEQVSHVWTVYLGRQAIDISDTCCSVHTAVYS